MYGGWSRFIFINIDSATDTKINPSKLTNIKIKSDFMHLQQCPSIENDNHYDWKHDFCSKIGGKVKVQSDSVSSACKKWILWGIPCFSTILIVFPPHIHI